MLEILFEDEWLLALNKPAGIVVHPTYKNPAGTLLDALQSRNSGIRFFIAGRLDKNTSGLVVAAKGQEAYGALQRTWREAEKDYLAVVHGDVDPPEGRIDLPLCADPHDRRRRVPSSAGLPSATQYERIASTQPPRPWLTLLRCRLLTGRRHQIRVHLAARGWPIVGDTTYGAAEAPAFAGHALHAWRIALTHPASGVRLSVEAPLTSTFVDLLTTAGLPMP